MVITSSSGKNVVVIAETKKSGRAELETAGGRLKESLERLPPDLKKKISFVMLSCLLLSAALLAGLYALDYLDMSFAERVIHKWSLGLKS